jgi:hypothetical protein
MEEKNYLGQKECKEKRRTEEAAGRDQRQRERGFC